MSTPLKVFNKTTIEVRRIYVDYSCFLTDVEKLTGLQALVSPALAPPLTLSLAYTDATNTKVVMYASGGIASTDYTVALVTTTDGGRTKQVNMGIRVTAP